MMNPDENVSTTGHKHDDRMMNNKAEIENATEVNAKAKMKKLIDEYKQLKNALVSDDFEASKTYYKQVNALFFNISSQEFQKVEKLNSIDELREEFSTEIAKAVEQVAKDKDYDVVLDKDEVRFGGVDITSDVLKELKK